MILLADLAGFEILAAECEGRTRLGRCGQIRTGEPGPPSLGRGAHGMGGMGMGWDGSHGMGGSRI